MGIYDRDYIKDGRRGGGGGGFRRPPSGLGRLQVLSVTAWIIIANVLVMLAQMALSSAGVPVHTGTEYFRPPSPGAHLVMPEHYFVPSRGVPLLMQQVSEADTKRVGNVIARPLFEVRPDGTRVPVGQNLYVVMEPLEAFGHFSTAKGFAELQVWRLVTFQFLHAGFAHLFFNMFGLFVFGPLVEQQLGGRRFLAFYLVCGIFGGLMYLALNLVGYLGIPMPGALDVDIWTPLVGASAGVFGVLMACAYIAPKAIVQLLFPPVALEMRWLVYAYFGLALWNLITGGHNQGGEAAHVGGALAGFYFIRRPWLLRDFFDVFSDSRKKMQRPGRQARGYPSDIDEILDKISQKGMQSLTDRERRLLTQHSKRRGNPD
ncbi:MAG: rhomboid family intramembrane serine protease [Planctomycetota bacterium]|nr:MAG: rhomboid family intramembrane serine protease [Planctomycetota bacterium]